MQSIKNIISSTYSKKNFIDLIKTLFDTSKYKYHDKSEDVSKKIFKKSTQISSLEFFVESIGFYHIEVENFNQKSTFAKDVIEYFDYGFSMLLIAYTQPNSNNWLLCYVDYEQKSYFYEVGEDIPINTPLQRLELLSKSKDNQTINTLKDAFSVEALNREFYQGIYKSFEEFRANIEYPSNDDKDKNEFIVRLIGRVLFLKFLEKKDIIPSSIFQIRDDYYHSTLEPLFYETLNKKVEDRVINEIKIKNSHSKSINLNNIPFLNGGLFDNQKSDFYELDSELKISTYLNTLKIPNETLQNFINHLNHYNFTIDENLDTTSNTLSLDPELLGLVFENLLAYINPETQESARKLSGSYYTPREIVNYMVSSSLLEYLKNSTSIDENLLKKLVFDSVNNFEALEKNNILGAIFKLKILDPACGSGAFPMGLLNKIVQLLDTIDIDGDLWFGMQSKEFRNKHQNRDKNYIRKLSIIQNSIFGVDISPIAIEISKLRFFLSLIIDEDSSAIEPLPNLEFKFVCANTLKEVDINVGSLEDSMKKLKEEYFYANGNKKQELKQKLSNIQADYIDNILSFSSALGSTNYDKLSIDLTSYDPFNSIYTAPFFNPSFMLGVEKFNLIIGNPPYIRQEKIKELKTYIDSTNKKRKKDKLSPLYYVYNGTADIYVYFFERAYQLLERNGVCNYIVSNKYTRAKYGKNLREFILSNCDILEYVDFNGVKVFESATVDTSIISLKKLDDNPSIKKENKSKNVFKYTKVDEKYKKSEELSKFINQNGFEYNQSDLSIDSFSFSNPDELKIKKKIEKIGTPLKDWDINIYRGILTGFNEAFIIDGKTKDKLIAKDKKSSEIIKPLLRGRDIKKYSYEFADKWLINSHNGVKEQNIKPINIEDYPAIKKHLDKYYDKLAKRSDKGDTPYNLRNCAYLEQFGREKIIYPETTQYPDVFVFDKNKMFLDKTSFMIIGNNLRYISSILNSKVLVYYMMNNIRQVGKGFQISKIFAEILPIPQISKEAQKPFEILVDYIMFAKEMSLEIESNLFESIIDIMVYGLYFEDELKNADCYINDEVNKTIKEIELSKDGVKNIYKTIKNNNTIMRGVLYSGTIKTIRVINGDNND